MNDKRLWERYRQQPSARLGPHPSEMALAAYLDGDGDTRSVDRIEAHLADCDDCLQTVLALRGLRSDAQRATTPAVPRRVAAWAAMVATLAVVSWTGYTLGASALMNHVQGTALVSQEASFGFPALRGSTSGRGIQ